MTYIATTVNGREYVVLRDGKIAAGPFVTVKEAIAVRAKLEREPKAGADKLPSS
jgi:hypothetical protein